MKRSKQRKPGMVLLYCAAALLVLAAGLFCLISGIAGAGERKAEPEETPPPEASAPAEESPAEDTPGVREVTEEERRRIEEGEKNPADGAAKEETNEKEKVSYLGTFTGEERLQPGISELITDFLDTFYGSQRSFADFFKTMDRIRVPDMTVFFEDPEGLEAQIWQNALLYLCSAKTVNGYDLSYADCSYSLKVRQITLKGDVFEVTLEESCDVSFAYLDGIRSVRNGLICEASFRKTEDGWKFVTYSRGEDFYRAIRDKVEEDMDASDLRYLAVEALERYCTNYVRMMKDRDSFNSGSVGYLDSENPYDRQAAGAYAAMYCLSRNSAYSAYDELGGNGQHFVSQVLFAGGIPMDVYGNAKWKYYGDVVDETEAKTGRTPSWIGAYYFHQYASTNYGPGLACTVNANFFAAEAGDVLQTGRESDVFNASYAVLDTYRQDESVIEILLCANTPDTENWPLSAIFAPYVSMIKVQGWKY